MTPSSISAEIGVFGGSGFYSFLEDVVHVPVHTPYGAPSAPVAVGSVDGRRVAFLPRHGVHHELPPHSVNFRANVWALHSLGVRRVIGPCAVGSLRPDLAPGSFVVLDQLVDRTFGRSKDTFFDGGVVGHVSFADPYCPVGRAAAVAAGAGAGLDVTDGGTLVVVNGPRFSSRAESREFQSHGWSIIGMTAMPEAALARELGLCYTTLALVTDLDAGVEAGDGVTHEEVLAAFAANLPRLRELLVATVAGLPEDQGDCRCGDPSALPRGFELP